MNVLLVPSFNLIDRSLEPYVPYGLLALKSAAENIEEVTIEIFRPSEDLLKKKFVETQELVDACFLEIASENFDVVGFSFVCNSAHYALSIAKKIKEHSPKTMILAGGPYVTKLSSEILEAYPFIDAVFVGESDVSFRKFLTNLMIRKQPFFGVMGVHTREFGLVAATAIENLDELSTVTNSNDYIDNLNITRKFVSHAVPAPLEASRGCPLKCSFCSTRQVWGAAVRRKSAKMLISEMSKISGRTGDDFFSLIGDNLGVPRNHFMRFCEDLIELENPYKWGCSLKLDRLTPENLKLMWSAGCRSLFIGVESSSQETLKRVNKAAILSHEIEGIYTAISLGFHVETSFIVGFPWETTEDVKNTYELHCALLKAGANRSQLGLLCPIPGTDIVDGEEIIFDGWQSYVAQDDLALSIEHQQMIDRNPKLFSHFGRYATPNIPRVMLKAYADAAMRISQLHTRNRRELTVRDEANHGRVSVLMD
jgi:anaerobic magnesium-protoporphyrin IX monomethyl ester cyclase